MTENERNLARVAIRHLQSLYNNAGDRGRIEELVGVFTADGTLEVPGASYAGSEAIAAFLSGVAGGGSGGLDLRGSRHHLTTSRIEIDDTSAHGWTYFFVMRDGVVLEEGTYIDRFVQTADGWRIAHRRVKLVFSREP